MGLFVRQGVRSDLSDVLSLIKELAKYEGAEDMVSLTIDDLKKDGFGKNPSYFFLVAVLDEKIVGVSFYWIRYSTWKGRFLFLEDFVVTQKHRRKGVGSLLFEETIRVAKKLKTNGMFWQVLNWNTPAINFYKKYGASLSDSWMNGVLTKSQLDSFS